MTVQENAKTTTAVRKSQVGVFRRISYWTAEVLVGDHAMKVAIGFFAIALFVLTKLFGPGA